MYRNSLAFLKIIIVNFLKIYFFLILIVLFLLWYVGETYYLELVNFLQLKKYFCAFSYAHVGEAHMLYFIVSTINNILIMDK